MTQSRTSNPLRWIMLLFAALSLSALACLSPVETALTPEPTTPSQPESVRPENTPVPSPISIEADAEETLLIRLYGRVNPAVAHIRIYDSTGYLLGSGSGFLVDDQGHLITNNHVVQEADHIEVTFYDATRTRAMVIGADLDADLAVLEAESVPAGISPLELGDSDSVQVGQRVIAIGNPFGLEGTMTVGIVSGLGRRLDSLREVSMDTGSFSNPDIIQTDAAINPGNSGGPLVNSTAQVIGINTAIRSTTGSSQGVGFASPVNTLKRLLPDLIEFGHYTYPWMGIASPQGEISLRMAEELGLPQTIGVYITEVTVGSPAEDAGLRAAGADFEGGDMIIAIDGEQTIDFGDLVSYLVSSTEPGQTILLTIIRDGDTIELPLTLGERP